MTGKTETSHEGKADGKAAKDDGKDEGPTPMAEGDERTALEARVEGLRAMGMPSADLAADVYEDVLAGKVAIEDADDEMTRRS